MTAPGCEFGASGAAKRRAGGAGCHGGGDRSDKTEPEAGDGAVDGGSDAVYGGVRAPVSGDDRSRRCAKRNGGEHPDD